MFVENSYVTLFISPSDMGWSAALEDFILPYLLHDTCISSVSVFKMLNILGRQSMPVQEAVIANSVWISNNLDCKSRIPGSVNPTENSNQSRWQVFLVLNLKIGSLQVWEQRPRLLDNLGKNPILLKNSVRKQNSHVSLAQLLSFLVNWLLCQSHTPLRGSVQCSTPSVEQSMILTLRKISKSVLCVGGAKSQGLKCRSSCKHHTFLGVLYW